MITTIFGNMDFISFNVVSIRLSTYYLVTL